MQQRAPQPKTVRALATAAGISNWDGVLWFKGAELKGNVLVVEDQTCLRFITNCWLPKMRDHIPGLQIAARTPEARKLDQKAKPSIWNKKGREYHSKRLGGMD